MDEIRNTAAFAVNKLHELGEVEGVAVLKVITAFVAGQDVFASFQPATENLMHAFHYSSIVSISWKTHSDHCYVIKAITEDITYNTYLQQCIATSMSSLRGLDHVNRKATAVIF